MNKPAGRLLAFEGAHGVALGQAARARGAERREDKACVSVWDASGIFGEVQLATVGAGDPSARTLLLLYAADLAYRVRAEIKPALAAGRLVVVAPYTATAIAFAEAAGLDPAWATHVLSFAPRPESTSLVDAPPAEEVSERKGFVEFSVRQLLKDDDAAGRLDLLRRTRSGLKSRLGAANS